MDCRILTRGTEYSISMFFLSRFFVGRFTFFYVFFRPFYVGSGILQSNLRYTYTIIYLYIYININVLLYIIFISFTTLRWIAADDATKRLQEWKQKK